MAAPASHGAASRQPLTHNGRRVANVYVRLDANGNPRYEFQAKRNGKTTRLTLEAKNPTDAVREANRLRVVSDERGFADGTLRLETLMQRFVAEARSGEYAPARGPLSASTLALYEQRLATHVLPALGHSTRARDVTTAHLRRLIDRQRLAGLSGSTIRGTVGGERDVPLRRTPRVAPDEPCPLARRRPPLRRTADGADLPQPREPRRAARRTRGRAPSGRGDVRVRRSADLRDARADVGRHRLRQRRDSRLPAARARRSRAHRTQDGLLGGRRPDARSPLRRASCPPRAAGEVRLRPRGAPTGWCS